MKILYIYRNNSLGFSIGIDKEKKGYVTEEEFNLIFDNKLNLEDLLLIMEKIDSDKDGKITYEDMVNLFK